MDLREQIAQLISDDFTQTYLGNKSVLETADAILELINGFVPVWQPIETEPRDGNVSIGWLHGWVPTPMVYCEAGAGWSEDQPGWYAIVEEVWLEPTHWMPLPPPPSARILAALEVK